MVGRSHHDLYDSEGTHPIPFSSLLVPSNPDISTSGHDDRDVFIPCFMTEDQFQQPSSDPYIQSILTTPNPVLDTEDSFSVMTSFGTTRPQASSMTLFPTQSFTFVPPLSTEVCSPPLTAHPVYHPPPICPTGCQLHHGSCNQAIPNTHVHNASGQDGRPTTVSFNPTVDSNPFQGFPSTQATSTSDSYYQGYPHILPDTHNVPGQEGCQMYSGGFPPSTSTQMPTAVKPSTNRTMPCGWKDEHGHICGVGITHECQTHFATAHDITKLSGRTRVTCRWCDKSMTRGCLVRHIREVHLRFGRPKRARARTH